MQRLSFEDAHHRAVYSGGKVTKQPNCLEVGEVIHDTATNRKLHTAFHTAAGEEHLRTCKNARGVR